MFLQQYLWCGCNTISKFSWNFYKYPTARISIFMFIGNVAYPHIVRFYASSVPSSNHSGHTHTRYIVFHVILFYFIFVLLLFFGRILTFEVQLTHVKAHYILISILVVLSILLLSCSDYVNARSHNNND